MAAIAVVSANAIAQAFPNSPATRLRNWRLLVAGTAGQAVYCDPTTGRAGLCNTATSGHEQFRGILMASGGAGDVRAVLEQGEVVGFNLTGIAYDAIIYANDVDGQIGTAAGTKSVPIGRVKALTDGSLGTPVILIASTTLSNY